MKYRAESQKDFFDNAKKDGYVVNGLAYVQNEKDIYIEWADKKIEDLLKAQNNTSNNKYTATAEPPPKSSKA